MLEWALAYAAHGWSVLPLHTPGSGCSCGDPACGSVGKHPRTAHGVKDASFDEQAVRAWWRTWPDSNIGLATGRGIIWVLDVDGAEGLAMLRHLETLHGPLPETPRVVTGGGGLHVYFSGGQGVRNRVGFAPGLDTRSSGGYVVAPPSLHRSGRQYQWAPDLSTPLAEAPSWLLALVTRSQADRPSSGETPQRTGSKREQHYTEAVLAGECECAARAVEGERNNTLNLAAFRVGQFLWALDEEEVVPRLLDAALSCGLGEREARATIKGGLRGGRRNSRGLPEEPGVQPGADGDVVWDGPAPQEPAPALDPAALHGLAGEYVRRVEPLTEAHPAGILAVFLARFGAHVGRAAHFSIGRDLHHARVWPCLVGSTSIARKGHATNLACAAFEHVPDADLKLVSGLSSGEGLIQALQGEVPKTASGTFPGFDARAVEHRRRAFIEEPEFARILAQAQRTGNVLSTVLRDAWDGKTLATTTRANPLHVERAHVTVVTGITLHELRKQLSAAEMANGFANRFFYVYTMRTHLLAAPPDIPDSLMPAEELRERIGWAQSAGQVGLTQAARELWATTYPEVTQERRGFVGDVTARGAPYVLRLALTYALLDGPACCDDSYRPLYYIGVPHLLAAKALWDFSDATCRWVWGSRTGDPLADRILEELKRAPGGELTRNDINELCGGNRASRQVQSALDLLRELGQVQRGRRERRGGTKGRPAEVWKVLAQP